MVLASTTPSSPSCLPRRASRCYGLSSRTFYLHPYKAFAHLMGSPRLHILFPWSMFEYGIFSSFLGEMIGLFILFVLWLVGSAISSVRLESGPYTLCPLTLTLSRADILGGARLVPRVPRVPHPHGPCCVRVDRLGHDPLPAVHHHPLRRPQPCAVLADAWAVRSACEPLRQGRRLNNETMTFGTREDWEAVYLSILAFHESTISRWNCLRHRHGRCVVVNVTFVASYPCSATVEY